MTKRSLLGGILIAASCAIGVLLIWASDRITLQGERTIFAVNCEGTWDGNRCSGRLVPGERYAFRASNTRQEVVFWIRGSQVPSGKYTDCRVKDRDNWSCDVRLDQRPAFTRAMVNGVLSNHCPESPTVFHWIPKWKWWALHMGVARFHSASGTGQRCAPR